MTTTTEEKKFEFDGEFQTKILGCMFAFNEFNQRTIELLKPQYFENDAEAALAKIMIEYFEAYKSKPDMAVIINILRDKIAKKTISRELLDEVKVVLKLLPSVDVASSDYVADKVGEFAHHAAMQDAILRSAELLDKGDFDAIDKILDKARQVGLSNSITSGYDFFDEETIEERMRLKDERLLGLSDPSRRSKVISSGIPNFDKHLYHEGFAKQEMVVFMGLPKAGKSIGLAFFAKNAAMQGKNVLLVTLEVSKDVMAERIEASITQVKMNELMSHSTAVAEKIKEHSKSGKVGKLILEERPTGTMTPSDLQGMITRYRNVDSIEFDMVVVDYADIMRPSRMTDSAIENSKGIYVDLRAIAQRENVALVTATQANREGTKGGTLRMEHAAEDFNKVRIADLLISINRTEEERAAGTARLFFAASRNQKGEFSVKVTQDLETMTFIKSVIGVE